MAANTHPRSLISLPSAQEEIPEFRLFLVERHAAGEGITGRGRFIHKRYYFDVFDDAKGRYIVVCDNRFYFPPASTEN